MAWASKGASPKRKLKAKVPIDTSERILKRAILLFNRHGIQNVAVGEIATALKISPGNLTYHFKRKEDLVHATFEVLMQQFRIVLQPAVPVKSPEEAAEYLIRLLKTLWDFRFFYNSITYLLTNNRELKQDFSTAREWILQTLEADLQSLVEQGHFLAAHSGNSFRLLASNLWGILLDRVRLQHIENPAAASPRNSALYESSLQLWSLCQPYMNPVFSDELLQVLQVRLGSEIAA